jgi:hypothetical protein
MARRPVTARVINASRRNIRRAQMSRRGIREVRSVGRITRSRQRYSKPPTASRAGRAVRTRRR